MELIHGGDWAGYLTEYGRLPLDFSQNVSPLGMPEGVRLAAAAALAESDRYPDPLCRALRGALSRTLGVPEGWILCGNGAADLIWRLMAAKKPRQVLLTAPSFQEYEAAASAFGSTVVFFTLPDHRDFVLTDEILDAITPKTGVLMLGQPGNPTGQPVEPALLMRILQRCRDCGTLLVVDECFLEFLPNPGEYTLISELKNGGLMLLRAFTKTYGMAGLRLGYCLCRDPGLLQQMQSCGQPWAVSNVAQAAGIAALEEGAYCSALRRLVQEQRPVLEQALRESGFRVIPGDGNFILFRSDNTLLQGALKERGILIRDCRGFRGLSPGWYRIAVRTREENLQLMSALKEVAALWQNG